MSGTNFSCNVTDEQWEFLKRLFPKPAKCGRKPLDRRAVLNAILYVQWTGCQWRVLTRDFPKQTKSDVHGFSRWSKRLAGMGAPDLWLDSADRAAARRRQGFCHPAETLDCRTHFRMDFRLATIQQRLRGASRPL